MISEGLGRSLPSLEQVKTTSQPARLSAYCVTLCMPLPLSGPLLTLSEGSDL